MQYAVIVTILVAFNIFCLSADYNNTPIDKTIASENESSIFAKLDLRILDQYLNANVPEEHLHELLDFYTARNNDLVWSNYGVLHKNGIELLRSIENAWQHGLSPKFYSVDNIKYEIKNIEKNRLFNPVNISKLDILLTTTYIDYASDLSTGRLNPGHLKVGWEIFTHKQNLAKYLTQSLLHGKIDESLENLAPKSTQYQKLSNALQRLIEQKEAGEWPYPGLMDKLEKNDSVPEVIKIKKYLFATGYLHNSNPNYLTNYLFDDELAVALANFQAQHGLEQDSIVGKNTLKQMNLSFDYRLEQIKINLDRLRWLPDNISTRDIIVNIPDFSLNYFQDQSLKQKMNVVVGTNKNYTPAIKDTITSIVFNPQWNVPYSMAVDEIIPELKKDSNYLAKRNFKLVSGSYFSKSEIDATKINWNDVSASDFPYLIVQKSGSTNSLGLVKFMLPNNQNIYLHDTPADHLFNRWQRNFSHGCVRLEKPFQLAEEILDGQISHEKVKEIVASKESKTIRLDKPVAVHIVYHTAWVDSQDRLQFRDDIYGYDEMSIPLFNTPSKWQETTTLQ
ncbi:L,D-transpeptidase family protein [Draconibacterium halophilum]|uniref:L,D-transpeptidase family protein n=1 Tax=Draconibacterium halophilum TaxID=2706887 RepID=A0A6C0RHI7_9BACT|nr:L,D-transpeptidase family protein [Draconibacterium halophilum]QIA09466.1 L,D-transpeptidase family protein [Draconibacterium halophilum]